MGGYFFLGNKDGSMLNNGAIHIIAKIIKNVVSSAAEAEIAGIFINAKEAVPIRQALIEMDHPQPATDTIKDNSTASGILNKLCKQVRSKAIDMRYYWVRDRISQKQFNLIWKAGVENLADYFTKHHSPAHHKQMRPIYLHLAKTELANRANACEGVLIGHKRLNVQTGSSSPKTQRVLDTIIMAPKPYRTATISKAKQC